MTNKDTMPKQVLEAIEAAINNMDDTDKIMRMVRGFAGDCVNEAALQPKQHVCDEKCGGAINFRHCEIAMGRQPKPVDGLVEALEMIAKGKCDTYGFNFTLGRYKEIARYALANYNKPKRKTVSTTSEDFNDIQGGGSTITTYIKTDTPDVIKRALRAFQQEYCFEDSEYDKAIEEFLKEEK